MTDAIDDPTVLGDELTNITTTTLVNSHNLGAAAWAAARSHAGPPAPGGDGLGRWILNTNDGDPGGMSWGDGYAAINSIDADGVDRHAALADPANQGKIIVFANGATEVYEYLITLPPADDTDYVTLEGVRDVTYPPSLPEDGSITLTISLKAP